MYPNQRNSNTALKTTASERQIVANETHLVSVYVCARANLTLSIWFEGFCLFLFFGRISLLGCSERFFVNNTFTRFISQLVRQSRDHTCQFRWRASYLALGKCVRKVRARALDAHVR